MDNVIKISLFLIAILLIAMSGCISDSGDTIIIKKDVNGFNNPATEDLNMNIFSIFNIGDLNVDGRICLDNNCITDWNAIGGGGSGTTYPDTTLDTNATADASWLSKDHNFSGRNIFNSDVNFRDFTTSAIYLNGIRMLTPWEYDTNAETACAGAQYLKGDGTCGDVGVSSHSSLSNLNWADAGHYFDTDVNLNNYSIYSVGDLNLIRLCFSDGNCLTTIFDIDTNAWTEGFLNFDLNNNLTQDWNAYESIYAENINYNEGMLTEVTLTDNADGTVIIGAGSCLIREDAVWNSKALYYFDVSAKTLTLDNNAVNYIYVDYNNGNPAYFASTNRDLINNSNIIPVMRIYELNNQVKYSMDYGEIGKSASIRNFDRIMRMRGITGIEKESGLSVSEIGNRVVRIGSGYAWFGLDRYQLTQIDQNGIGVESHLWYHTGGVWTDSEINAYNNTQYDDGTDLQTLLPNRYAVNWIFRNLVSNEIDIVLGNGDYTLAQAESSEIPVLPDTVSNFYVLVGRIIVQKDSNTAYTIENVTTTAFTNSIVQNHNDLSNLNWASAGHIIDTDLNMRLNSIESILDANFKGKVEIDGNLILNSQLGIGTLFPEYKLDVRGDVNAKQYCLTGDCINDWDDVNKGVAGEDINGYISRFTYGNIDFNREYKQTTYPDTTLDTNTDAYNSWVAKNHTFSNDINFSRTDSNAYYGSWVGDLISPTYLDSTVMVEGENISLLNNDAGYLTTSLDTNYQTSSSDFNSAYDNRYVLISNYHTLWSASFDGNFDKLLMARWDDNFNNSFMTSFDNNTYGSIDFNNIYLNTNITFPDTTLDTNTIANLQWLNTQHLFTQRVDMNSDLNMQSSSIVQIKDFNLVVGSKTYSNGYLYKHQTGLDNDFEGKNSGKEITTGYDNYCRGSDSCYSLNTGINNTIIGTRALYRGENVSGITAIGTESLRDLNNSSNNMTSIGYWAGRTLNFPSASSVLIGSAIMKDGNILIDSVLIGDTALLSGRDIRNSVAIGKSTFGTLLTPSKDFIAIGSGLDVPAYNTDVNGQLWIDIEATSTPLIFGDFYNDYVLWNADEKHPDDYREYFGTSDDVSIYYDSGTGNWYFKLDEVGAHDMVITSADDTVSLLLEDGAKVWQLDYWPWSAMEPDETEWGSVSAPSKITWITDGAGSTGVVGAIYVQNQDSHLYGSEKLSGQYEENTEIIPMVNWSPLDAGNANVIWELEYTAQIPGSAFPLTTISQITVATGGVQYLLNEDAFDVIPGNLIRYVIDFRLSRLGADEHDDYNQGVVMKGLAFYYNVDRIGSTQQLVK